MCWTGKIRFVITNIVVGRLSIDFAIFHFLYVHENKNKNEKTLNKSNTRWQMNFRMSLRLGKDGAFEWWKICHGILLLSWNGWDEKDLRSTKVQLLFDFKIILILLLHFELLMKFPLQFVSSSPQRSSSIVQPTSSQLRRLSKSDSVPNLHDANVETLLLKSSSPTRRVSRHHHKHHTTRVRKVSNERTSLHRSNALRFQRFALSVDETHPLQPDSSHGSQCSVTFDPKPEIIDIVPVHKKREQRTKRSDTARKHILSRQQPIEQRDENHQQSARHDDERRPGSALSDNSVSSPRHEQLRMGGSPDRVPTRHSPKKLDSVIFSTPSVEKDFR